MYLHLGNNKMIKMQDVVGIFDLDSTTISKKTRDFLAEAEKKGEVISVSFELPKSFVVCKNEEGKKIYLSQLSSSTLHKRLGYIESI